MNNAGELWDIRPADDNTKCSGYHKHCLLHSRHSSQMFWQILLEKFKHGKKRDIVRSSHIQQRTKVMFEKLICLTMGWQHTRNTPVICFSEVHISATEFLERISNCQQFGFDVRNTLTPGEYHLEVSGHSSAWRVLLLNRRLPCLLCLLGSY